MHSLIHVRPLTLRTLNACLLVASGAAFAAPVTNVPNSQLGHELADVARRSR